MQEGKRRSARYRIPTSGAAGVAAGLAHVEGSGKVVLPLWKAGLEIQKYVRQAARGARTGRIQPEIS